MAKETKIEKENGKHKLKALKPDKDKHAEIEGIDTSKYDVYDSDKNLEEAKQEANKQNLNIDWFACYAIKDKQNNNVKMVSGEYTIKFDKPTSGNKLYYYYKDDQDKGNLESVVFSDAEPGRVKTSLDIGDPPIGTG